MSVVAIKINEKTIDIAADSIIVKGGTKRTDSSWHKLTQVNDMIIGSVGAAEETSLLINFCKTHSILAPTTSDVQTFMCEFLDWKLSKLEDGDIENDYIIVFKGKAFSVNHLFVEEINDYDAIGAGEDFALAALYLGHSAKDAVEVACKLSCYVAEPIIYYSVKKAE